MGVLVFVNAPPQRQAWKVIIDGRAVENEEDLLDWLRTCSGDVMYTTTRFADKRSPKIVHNNRKRNFTDGYLQYTIWFTKKSDAALCRMFWEIQ